MLERFIINTWRAWVRWWTHVHVWEFNSKLYGDPRFILSGTIVEKCKGCGKKRIR